MEPKSTTTTSIQRRLAPCPPRRVAPIDDPNRYWFAPIPIDHLHDSGAGGGRNLRSFYASYCSVPTTNFPRIIVAWITASCHQPDGSDDYAAIEEAVNSVPGLQNVRSITSRGSAEIDLDFDWSVDMVVTLQQVNSAIARIQSSLPMTAQIEAHRLDLRAFRSWATASVGQSSANPTLELATYSSSRA